MIVFPLGDADGVLTKEQLDANSTPAMLGQLEAIPQPLWDTQSFATGDTGPFQFFVGTNTDATVTNLATPGQLAADQYYILQYVFLDILQVPSAGTDAAVNPAIANVANILITNNPIIELQISQKQYGPWPAMMAGCSGGVTGFAYDGSAAAAGVNAASVNNGIPGQGGFPYGGSIIIAPRTTFKAVLSLKNAGALTLVNGPILVRLGLQGTLYRNVR